MGSILRRALTCGLLSWVAAAFAQDAAVQVLDPWVQAAPPQAKVLAAYLELRSTGTEARTLRGASSPAFERVEIHRTVIANQIARMEPVTQLEIAPGSSLRMQPGGLHLMLINPRQRLQAGDSVSLSLQFKNGGTVAVLAKVRAPMVASAAAKKHDHGEHGAHAH